MKINSDTKFSFKRIMNDSREFERRAASPDAFDLSLYSNNHNNSANHHRKISSFGREKQQHSKTSHNNSRSFNKSTDVYESKKNVLLEFEREKNMKLEEMLAMKEKSLRDMNIELEDLYCSKKTMEHKFVVTLENKDRTIAKLSEEKEILSDKVTELEKITMDMERDFDSLQNKLKRKLCLITELQDQNEHLKKV